jgi:magnesium chelatase subunit D
MTTLAPADRTAWDDAALAAAILAVAPHAIGGIVLRARSGPVRDAWLALLKSLLPDESRTRRVPLNVGDDRLLGGLDLSATLAAGRPVAERGLLAEADGGVLIVPSAERLDAGRTARIVRTLDHGRVEMERDGLSTRLPARFGVVALDEGADAEETVLPALRDRLAIWLPLDGLSLRAVTADAGLSARVAAARDLFARTNAEPQLATMFCEACEQLGIVSIRAPILALTVARIAAALDGRTTATTQDAELAARLVLGPRATRLPMEAPQENPEGPEPEPQQGNAPETTDPAGEDIEPQQAISPEDMELVLAAAAAAIPASVLASLAEQKASGRAPPSAGKAGASRASKLRGRPAGVRRGEPRNGHVLSLIETLRCAAPMQAIRRRLRGGPMLLADGRPRIEVRADDFRISRFKQKTNSTTIFVVDASGSSALHRLGEAKGAVEIILSECYVRRDSVALIAFRGTTAETLLPPTRSLTRAQRCLASLPGGGGTPLAIAIDSAMTLAAAQKQKGISPTVVLLTDGKANIDKAGKPGRKAAMADAIDVAQAMRGLGINALLIDTSPRRNAEAEQLAAGMGARYLPLPHADSTRLSQAVFAARRDQDDRSGPRS